MLNNPDNTPRDPKTEATFRFTRPSVGQTCQQQLCDIAGHTNPLGISREQQGCPEGS